MNSLNNLHRQREFQREDLVKQLSKDRALKSSLSSDKHAESLRAQRQERESILQQKKQQELINRANEREERRQQTQLEQEALEAFEKANATRIRQEKLRSNITKNSPEIKNLERLLSSAYMNQERSLQVSQKGLIREYEKKRDELLNAEMQKRLDSLNEIASKKEEEAVLKSLEYQADLEGQLEEIAERKRDDHKQFLREKAMVDEIIQKIREEEDKEQEFRMLQAKETKQFIQDYIVQRQEYKKAELERIKLENKKIEDYAKFIEQREKDLSTKKLEESKGRSEIYERLAAEMERKDQEKTDLEDLRLALYLEEESEANRMFEQNLLQTRIKQRLEVIESYRNQIEEKRRRYEQDQIEQESYRKEMMEKYSQDKRLEQMNAQKRRMRQLEHRRAVEALIEERRRNSVELLDFEKEMLLKEKEIQKYKDEVVEQERQRLLRDHAVGLANFLPKGVLRDEKDLELFDQNFKERFEKGLQTK